MKAIVYTKYGIFYEQELIILNSYVDEFINIPSENEKDGLWLDWKIGPGTCQRFFDNTKSDPKFIKDFEMYKEIRLKEIKEDKKNIAEDKKDIKSLERQLQKAKKAVEKYERDVREKKSHKK